MMLVRINRPTTEQEIAEVFGPSWAAKALNEELEPDFPPVIAYNLANRVSDSDTVSLYADLTWDGYCSYGWFLENGRACTEYTLDEFIKLFNQESFESELEAILNAGRD